jgi:plasmid stabilization system protein ParE
VIELTWSPRAIADLEEIRAYIAADSRPNNGLQPTAAGEIISRRG